MNNFKQRIAMELLTLSRAVGSLSDEELCVCILDTCSGLVSVLGSYTTATAFTADGVEDVASGVDGLQQAILGLVEKVGGAGCMQVDTEASRRLTQALQTAKELSEREREASAELAVLLPANEALAATVNEREEALRVQQQLNASLLEKQKEYSEETLTALKEENDRLVDEIAEKKKRVEQLQEARKEHLEKLAGVQSRIDQLPSEQQMLEAFEERQAYLEKLLKAKSECGPEKMNEMKNSIYDLEQLVRRQEADMAVLRRRKEELEAARTVIDTDKGVFETEWIGKLEASMADLKGIMTAHKARLNELKDQADALKKSIEECEAIRRNYKFMFDTMTPPLNAIAKAAKMEHEHLKKHLDVRVSARIRELTSAIERDLTELGMILNKCREVIAVDQAELKRKVFEG